MFIACVVCVVFSAELRHRRHGGCARLGGVDGRGAEDSYLWDVLA